MDTRQWMERVHHPTLPFVVVRRLVISTMKQSFERMERKMVLL